MIHSRPIKHSTAINSYDSLNNSHKEDQANISISNMDDKNESNHPKSAPLSPLFVASFWMTMGTCMVIFNKTILSSWKFNYPFFLTTMHCTIASILTRIMAATTNQLPAVNENKVSYTSFCYKIFPISIFFASGLLCGNNAYSYLSVAYIQMLKSFTPIPMVLMSYMTGREKPSLTQFALIVMITAGVAMTSVGEAEFVLVGFMLQIGAVLSDVSRTSMMDLTLSDLKLDSLSLLYYMMPPSSVVIGIGFLMKESATFPWDLVLNTHFKWILLANGLFAFLLNISVVLVVKYTSPVTLSLCGIMKDITLVFSSTIIFNTHVSGLQIFGYSISIMGLLIYRAYKQDPTIISQKLQQLYQIFNKKKSFDEDEKFKLRSISTSHKEQTLEIESLLPSTQRN